MAQVILPVLNESGALGGVLDAIPNGISPIVVDNGSTDDSVEIAERHGANVVNEPIRGFGAACWSGLMAATHDIVAFMDADGSLDPVHLVALIALVEHGGADMAVGSRMLERGSMPPHARVANGYLAHRLRKHTNVVVRDIGPMRVMRRQALIDLEMVDRRFGWPLEMVIKADAAGWNIYDVGVPYAKREGKSKVTGTLKGTYRAITDMARYLP